MQHNNRVSGDGRAGATAPTTDQLVEIEARWAHVHPNGWQHEVGAHEGHDWPVCFLGSDADGTNHQVTMNHVPASQYYCDAAADAEAIAAAPSDIAWLCTEVERLRAALTRLGGAHE
jgi:hypothetical protein